MEEQYRTLIDTANAPIFGVDVSGNVTVWNKCASRISGFTSDEVMNRNLVTNYITKEHQHLVQAVLNKAMVGDETANFEFPLVTSSGSTLSILLNATSRRDGSNNIIGMVGIGQDITARVAQEKEYRTLIDTANAPIFGVDVSGNVTVWNKCASRISGFASEEVMERNLVSNYITKEHQHRVQAVLNKALLGDETANFEFPLVTSSGSTLSILLNATSRRDDNNNIIGVVGIGQDITQLRAEHR